MVWSSLRGRGRAMGPGSPARLRIRWRGWPAMPRSPCWRCCCGSPGARGGRGHHPGGRCAGGDHRSVTGLRRIGVDEISYRKGHRYLLCVVDHDTGRLVWADKRRDAATLRRFFDVLGEDRAALLTHISADGAEWIHTVAAERAPQALVCLDAFHVVA